MAGKVRVIVGTILLCGAIWTVLVSTLRAPVPDIVETPLVDADPSWSVQVTKEGLPDVYKGVPLAETAGPPPPVYVMSLALDDPTTLLRSNALAISFGTSETTPIRAAATLEVVGTSCVFGTAPDAEVAANTRLLFTSRDGCRRVQGFPQGELKLTVKLDRRTRLAVWAYQPPPGTTVRGAIATSTIPGWAYEGPPLLIDARYVTRLADTRTRRIDLLTYVWQVSDNVRWIWTAVAAAIGLLAFGVALLLIGASPAPASSSRVQASMRFAAGTGCVAAALGLLYAVLVPPLHAPDEIDHLLGYGTLTSNPSVATAAADWARRTHFERIKFRVEERFRPIDRALPFPRAWAGHVAAENVAARSPATSDWWILLAQWIRGATVPETLLLIRLANVLIFGGAVALGTLVLAWSAPADIRFPELLTVFPLLVPALPFFAMYVSVTALVSSIYVVFACSTLALFLDGRRTAWMGLPIGVALGLMLSNTRSAIPMLPLATSVLVARAVLGSRQARQPGARLREALRFWLGLALGSASMLAVIGPHFVADVEANLRATSDTAATLLGWLQLPLHHLWVVFFTLVAMGFALELASGRLRASARAGRLAGVCRGPVRWIAWTAAALVASSFLLSLLIKFPHLVEDGSSSSSRTYLMRVLATAATSFRLRDPDLSLSSSFWAGFGWLETVPAAAFVNLLVLFTGASLVGLLVRLGRDRDLRRFAWLAIAGAGGWATVVAYALGTFPMGNLHSRYLIGLYLCFLAICFSILASGAPEGSATGPGRHALTFALIGGAHTYCLWFILVRYF